MRQIAVALMLLVTFSTPQGVSAQGDSKFPATSEPTPHYRLDPAHTQVSFSVDRFGFTRVQGFFDDVTGEVVFDRLNPALSAVHTIIPIASLDTGNAERDGFLRGQYWLNGDAFPTMEFRSTSVRPLGGQKAEVDGELTLVGVTAPVTMLVTLNNQGIDPSTRLKAIGFSATGTLLRSTFGVRTAPPIGDEVRFSIEAFAFSPEAG